MGPNQSKRIQDDQNAQNTKNAEQIPKIIQFIKSSNIHVRTLCKINDSETDIDIMDFHILGYLMERPKRRVKVCTIFGETGEGKSLLLEIIASIILEKPYRLFNQSSNIKQYTQGIQYLITELDNQTDLILFDCEGFDNTNLYDDMKRIQRYQEKLYQLIGLIARLSTVNLHVTRVGRVKSSFLQFLKAIDIEEKFNEKKDYYKQKGILSNLIEILNQCNDLEGSKSEIYDIFHKKYHISEIQIDKQNNKIEMTQDTFQTFNQIAYDIKYSEYNSFHDNNKCFEQNPTFDNLFNTLIYSFNEIRLHNKSENRFLVDKINLQLHLKSYVKNQIEKLYVDDQNLTTIKVENMLQNIQSGNLISFFLMDGIIQTTKLFSARQFFIKIQELKVDWNKKLAQGLQQILKFDENSQLTTNIISQQTSMEQIYPSEFQILDEFQSNNFNIQNINQAPGNFQRITSISNLFLQIFFRLANINNIQGLIEPQSTFQCLFSKFIHRDQLKGAYRDNWKNEIKQNLKQRFDYFRLNIGDNEQVNQNLHNLEQILKDLVGKFNFENLTRQKKQTEIEIMVVLFYLNVSNKTLKIKNLERIYQDKHLLDIINHIDVVMQGLDEKNLKNIFKYCLNKDFQKQEKQIFKNAKVDEVFECQSLKFKQDKYNKQALQFFNTHPNLRENQSCQKLISCLLLFKLGWSDLFSNVIQKTILPLKYFQNINMHDPQRIQMFLDFQQSFLNTNPIIKDKNN